MVTNREPVCAVKYHLCTQVGVKLIIKFNYYSPTTSKPSKAALESLGKKQSVIQHQPWRYSVQESDPINSGEECFGWVNPKINQDRLIGSLVHPIVRVIFSDPP
jgi:hypothetical protein